MRKIIILLSAVTATLFMGVIPAYAHAHSPAAIMRSDPTGLCQTPGNLHCWRASFTSGAVDEWPRNIAGDPLQQFAVQCEPAGCTVSSSGCLQGLPQNLQNALANTGVFLINDGSNFFIGAGYQGYLGEDTGNPGGNSYYDEWAWTTGGQLINCGQSQYWRALDFLCGVPDYNQMYVRGTCGGSTWDQVHV